MLVVQECVRVLISLVCARKILISVLFIGKMSASISCSGHADTQHPGGLHLKRLILNSVNARVRGVEM